MISIAKRRRAVGLVKPTKVTLTCHNCRRSQAFDIDGDGPHRGFHWFSHNHVDEKRMVSNVLVCVDCRDGYRVLLAMRDDVFVAYESDKLIQTRHVSCDP